MLEFALLLLAVAGCLVGIASCMTLQLTVHSTFEAAPPGWNPLVDAASNPYRNLLGTLQIFCLCHVEQAVFVSSVVGQQTLGEIALAVGAVSDP